MKKIKIISNGCVPNRLEGKQIIERCRKSGWDICDGDDKADYVIFNSCGYCGDKIAESKNIISKYSNELRPRNKLIITGCLPKIDPNIRNDKNLICDYYENLGEIIGTDMNLNSMFVSGNIIDILDTTQKDIYHIITSQGCRGKCTYCAISKAKGSIKSKPLETIKEEFDLATQNGFKKIILWGEDLGAYGFDISFTIIDLLKHLIKTTQKNNFEYKLYLHRFNPQWIVHYFEDLIEIFKSKKIRMIYSPIQSGSKRILNLMNRKYSLNDLEKSFLHIKKEFPDILLKTDIMVGFPTETEEDFNMTIDFIEKVKFDDIVLFKYSEIPGTKSFRMNGIVNERDKIKRINRFWQTFPSIRFQIEIRDKKGWIIDKNKSLKRGPFCLNPYTL